MVYILTGVAKSGKTLISDYIVKQYGIEVVSTDSIMVKLFKENTALDIDLYASDRSVASKIEPYLYDTIKRIIKENKPCLIEGVHFNTPFARKLLNEFPNDINLLYLGYKDVSVADKVKELYTYKNKIQNVWIFNHPGEKVEDIIAYLIGESKRIYEECLANDLHYVEIRNIEKQKHEIVSHLLKL